MVDDAEGDVYVLNRKEYKLSSEENPNAPENLTCFVPAVGMPQTSAQTGKRVTDGIRLPATVTNVVISDVMIAEQNVTIGSLRMEPGSKLMSRPWPMDDGDFTSPTLEVQTSMTCVGDKNRILDIRVQSTLQVMVAPTCVTLN